MISVGDRTCALAKSGEAYCTDGSEWCWGDNCDGQLGDGSTPKPCNFVTYADTSAVPLRVKDPAP